MSKKGKVILIGAVVVLSLVAVWYFFFSGSSMASWDEFSQKDIAGSDISNESGVTLDQAKAKAASLGAKAFVYYPGEKRAWYKSSATGITNGWNPGTYSTYVKK